MSDVENVEFTDKTGVVRTGALRRAHEDSVSAIVAAGTNWSSELLSTLAESGIHLLELNELGDDDRAALAAWEAAARWVERELDVDHTCALGHEHQGTRAFLLGCTSNVLAGTIVVDGALVLEELDRDRPFQPLEMALGLECPLLAFYGQENEAITAADHEGYAAVLSQFSRSFDIVARPGDGRGPLTPAELQRIVSFVHELAD